MRCSSRHVGSCSHSFADSHEPSLFLCSQRRILASLRLRQTPVFLIDTRNKINPVRSNRVHFLYYLTLPLAKNPLRLSNRLCTILFVLFLLIQIAISNSFPLSIVQIIQNASLTFQNTENPLHVPSSHVHKNPKSYSKIHQ